MIWGYHYFRKHPYVLESNEDDFIREVLGGVQKLQILSRSYLLSHTRHPKRFDMERSCSQWSLWDASSFQDHAYVLTQDGHLHDLLDS